MSKPKIIQNEPFLVEVEAGKVYKWCACGLSANQPFCDGAHMKTTIKPVTIVAERNGKMYFCGCKNTNRQPFCDGTHSKL